MSTYTVSFTSRDERGRFERFHATIPAENVREAEEWVLHGERNGRWSVDSEVTISEVGGDTKTFEV